MLDPVQGQTMLLHFAYWLRNLSARGVNPYNLQEELILSICTIMVLYSTFPLGITHVSDLYGQRPSVTILFMKHHLRSWSDCGISTPFPFKDMI
jgi:hypothetical protein